MKQAGKQSHRSRRPDLFRGIWHIRETALWASDDLNLLGPAEIRFGAHQLGEMRLIAIQAAIDYRVGVRDGEPSVEFSWLGLDDSSPASGRGWAILRSKAMAGMLYIHQGSESTFLATKTERPTETSTRLHRKKISEGQTVLVGFTDAERRLVLDTSADPEYMKRLRPARGSSKLVGLFELDDLDDILGYIAAEANHTDDAKRERRLRKLYDRLSKEMELYDDGNWPTAF